MPSSISAAISMSELIEQLRKKGYKPEAVRRFWIRKANGGIATIKDDFVSDDVTIDIVGAMAAMGTAASIAATATAATYVLERC